MAPLLGLTGVGRDNALVHRLENREHGNGVGLRANSPKALFLVGESLEESSRAVWRIAEALHAIAGLASNQSWGKKKKRVSEASLPTHEARRQLGIDSTAERFSNGDGGG